MLRRIAYSRPLKLGCRLFFSLFYDPRYLRGYYFETKRMGWLWAWRGLGSRLWGENRRIPWPVHPRTIVAHPDIEFDVDNINIFQTPGCYWQNHGAPIQVGRDSYIAPNVGIITTNHRIDDPSQHIVGKPVSIGRSCWVGMNAVILPGVELGDHTVVAAGAVVTKSFPAGYCVVAGVPARIVKTFGDHAAEARRG